MGQVGGIEICSPNNSLLKHSIIWVHISTHFVQIVFAMYLLYRTPVHLHLYHLREEIHEETRMGLSEWMHRNSWNQWICSGEDDNN